MNLSYKMLNVYCLFAYLLLSLCPKSDIQLKSRVWLLFYFVM